MHSYTASSGLYFALDNLFAPTVARFAGYMACHFNFSVVSYVGDFGSSTDLLTYSIDLFVILSRSIALSIACVLSDIDCHNIMDTGKTILLKKKILAELFYSKNHSNSNWSDNVFEQEIGA